MWILLLSLLHSLTHVWMKRYDLLINIITVVIAQYATQGFWKNAEPETELKPRKSGKYI